jgi:hypothetical protein
VSAALPSAGYSQTPLAKKLGFKAGQRVAFVGLPRDLAGLASAEAFADVAQAREAAELGPEEPFNIVHAFYERAHDLAAALGCLRAVIRPAGAIWISWPKKAAKLATDITEDVVRAHAVSAGLVDVKVCAVSDVWSGLKLVIPVANRPKA